MTRRMRRFVTTMGAAALVAGCAGLAHAQGAFEGVVTLAIAMGDKPTTATAWIKGDRLRMETQIAGIPGAMISDGKGNMIMLIAPMKQYSVMNMKGMMDAAGPGTLQFAKTGRRDTVVGQSCEYYTMARTAAKDGAMGQACVTTELGFVGLNVGSRGSGMLSPADEAALRKQFPTGFMVLKQLGADGKQLYEVTKIARESVADSMFVPPAGYTEMKMPMGMPPPGE